MLNQIIPIANSRRRVAPLSAASLFMVNLLVRIGAPAAAWPPGLPPAQASDDKRGAAQSAEVSHSLEPGKPVERELSGGRSHFYKITMTSGQYLQITVRQMGIDALVALYTPDGKKIDDADSEHATEGSETVSEIADAAGAYMVEARSAEKTAQTGRYEIKVEELRAATAEDKYRVAGENEALPIFQFVGSRNGEAAALLGIARCEQQRGNLTQARQTIEQSVGMIESLRTNIAGQELRASYFASRQEFYQSYIDVLMRMHMQNPTAAFDSLALEVSERARARSLLELLTESRADIRQGVDVSLLERERSLQQRLNAKARAQFALLNRKHTPAQAEAFAKEIASLTTEYEELKALIRARGPRYAALTQAQPLGLAEIQQQVLGPDTLLLEYSLGSARCPRLRLRDRETGRRGEKENLALSPHRPVAPSSSRHDLES